MILVFASSLHSIDEQNNLLYSALKSSGKDFVFLNPLHYEELQRLQLLSSFGVNKLLFDGRDISPSTIFHSRLLRADCFIDLPDSCLYPSFLRQKISSFLEEIIFCFKEVNIFPGKYESIQLGESKCAVYRLAHNAGLTVPINTINSFFAPAGDIDYKKVLGFPFSISLNTEIGKEVAVTLLNEKNSEKQTLIGFPWQWQTAIKPKKHIRCVIVGDRIWTYSLSESQLNGRSLREAHEDDNKLLWQEDELPLGVQNSLRRLLSMIGLRYSAPEFLVDINGKYVFIDLNPCGDWFGFSNEKDGTEIAHEIIAKL